MKIFKNILIWSLVAAFIESVMLFSLNKIYAEPLDNYKEEKSLPQSSKKTYEDVKIGENADNVKVSYDGKYVSYSDDEGVKIVNSGDGSINSIDISGNGSVCYSKWLPDSNLFLICEKDAANKVSFFSYDADKDTKKELTDFDTQPLKIQLGNKSDTIDSITLSTANHVMYIKVLHKNQKSDIYKINVMNQVEKMKNSNSIIGSISMLHNDTNLIYEDIEEEEIKNISVTSVKTSNKKSAKTKEVTKINNIDINDNSKKVLLGTDNEDKIYIGVMENNKVSKIIFGDLKTSTDQWRTLKLQDLTDKKNIIVTKDGGVYVKDDAKGLVKNVLSNIETKYSGIFVEIQSNYIYVLSDNKVSRVLIK